MKANCLFYLNHLGGKAAEKTVQGLPNAVERIAKVLRAEEEESRLTRIPSGAGSGVFVGAPHTERIYGGEALGEVTNVFGAILM